MYKGRTRTDVRLLAGKLIKLKRVTRARGHERAGQLSEISVEITMLSGCVRARASYGFFLSYEIVI